MPAWILAALRLLAGTPLRAGITGTAAGTLLPDFVGFPGFGGDAKPRRRRRRRALTASDRADIAFLAGLLGPKAGKDLATIIAART